MQRARCSVRYLRLALPHRWRTPHLACAPHRAFLVHLHHTHISAGLLGIEQIGIEIENPFDLGHTDLPLDGMCHVIRRNIMELWDRNFPGKKTK